jgi:hypothetical protein
MDNLPGNPQWEYYIEYIVADARQQEEFLQQIWPGAKLPKYVVQATLPRLNELGALGWELLHMQPVEVGVNGDICITRGDAFTWSHTYFCVFKRLKSLR